MLTTQSNFAAKANNIAILRGSKSASQIRLIDLAPHNRPIIFSSRFYHVRIQQNKASLDLDICHPVEVRRHGFRPGQRSCSWWSTFFLSLIYLHLIEHKQQAASTPHIYLPFVSTVALSLQPSQSILVHKSPTSCSVLSSTHYWCNKVMIFDFATVSLQEKAVCPKFKRNYYTRNKAIKDQTRHDKLEVSLYLAEQHILLLLTHL